MQGIAGAGFWQPRPIREVGGQREIGAVTGDEDEGNIQGIEPLGNRKALLADQPDVEQGKVRRALGDHFERSRHASRRPHPLGPKTQNCFLEVERDDQVILDNQHVLGQVLGKRGIHGFAGEEFHNRIRTMPEPACRRRPEKAALLVPIRETITSQLRLSVHLYTQFPGIRRHGAAAAVEIFAMDARGGDGTQRPFNNLLRRLSGNDFALIAPYLAHEEAAAGDLLYNPGDGVEIVHFPCGTGLASYLVANEDGRDVETILVGREGAVGGIVSEGYLPAYTRIMVKFGGPFVRLHVGKLDAAKTRSNTLRNVFARYADCMLAQIFQSTACNAIHSIEQRTAKWILSAMERTDDDNVVPLTHEQLATLLGVGRSYTSRVIQTFKALGILETRRGSILVRNREALQMRSCLCNESVKNHFEEVLRGVYPTEEARSS